MSEPQRAISSARPDGTARPSDPGAVDGTVVLRFEVFPAGNGDFGVRLSSDGYEPAESRLELSLNTDSRIQSVIDRINENRIGREDLRDVGSQLWAGLVAGDVGGLFDRICADTAATAKFYQIRLCLPRVLEFLPWETCYDERGRGFLACTPPFALVRDPPRNLPPVRLHVNDGAPLRVLVAVPANTGLQAAHEWDNLRAEVSRHGGNIVLERLQPPVTPDRLSSKLRSERWDVFHFVGHGRLDGDGNVNVILTGEGERDAEQWLQAEDFTGLFRESTVQLAVLNCCLGAHPSAAGCLSGLGPGLLAAGLTSVVAMRYEIPDDEAVRFARSFYRELFTSPEAGRIDIAVLRARQSLKNNESENRRVFVTPVLYLARDSHGLANVRAPVAVVEEDERTKPVEKVEPPVETYEVPQQLLEEVRSRRCVLVVGPQLLRAGAVRSAEPASLPPGPRELAAQLAQDYPDTDEIRFVAAGPDWVAHRVLERVCQHYCLNHRIADLANVLRGLYLAHAPGELLLTIARWNVAGVMYTHFDGLLARAFDDVGRKVRVVNRIDQDNLIDDGLPMLVNLRGSVDDPDSLVLTEEDHETLQQRLMRISARVTSMMNQGVGRSFLFLGVSPQDQALRDLVGKLVPDARSRSRGPVFFVRPSRSEADEAYWQRFGFQWLDGSPADVIRAIDRAIH